MIGYALDENEKLNYHLCGKFIAPSLDWMHLTRELHDYELMVVTEGTLYIANETTRFIVKEGEYVLLEPTIHQYGYKKGSVKFYWLHFERDSLFRTVMSPSNSHNFLPIQAKIPSLERIIILMKQLQDSSIQYHNNGLNNTLTTAILQELTCQMNDQGHQPKQLYNDMTDYIRYRCCENLKVSELAAVFGYNNKYLSAFFRQQSNQTVKQFILKVKMENAMAQLSDTNHSISQIAYNLGFTDVHNFSNAFKKITGLTPTNYRNSFSKRSVNYE